MSEEIKNEEVNVEETVDETEEVSDEKAADRKAADESLENEESEAADEEGEALEEGEESSEEKGKKKGFFKKDKKDPKDAKIEELVDQVKRQMAEFENFRKRTEKEKSSMYEMGATAVVEKILPVIDNFERGLLSAPEGDDPFTQGMKMIYKQLVDELEKLGVKPIEALGKEFDPNFHNAVMQVESEEYETGFVAQELQKGYMYRDTVVRYSMVAVVQ